RSGDSNCQPRRRARRSSTPRSSPCQRRDSPGDGALGVHGPSLQLRRVPGDEELKREAGRELRDLDERALFWIDVAVAKHHGVSADDVDWTAMAWSRIREE